MILVRNYKIVGEFESIVRSSGLRGPNTESAHAEGVSGDLRERVVRNRAGISDSSGELL